MSVHHDSVSPGGTAEEVAHHVDVPSPRDLAFDGCKTANLRAIIKFYESCAQSCITNPAALDVSEQLLRIYAYLRANLKQSNAARIEFSIDQDEWQIWTRYRKALNDFQSQCTPRVRAGYIRLYEDLKKIMAKGDASILDDSDFVDLAKDVHRFSKQAPLEITTEYWFTIAPPVFSDAEVEHAIVRIGRLHQEFQWLTYGLWEAESAWLWTWRVIRQMWLSYFQDGAGFPTNIHPHLTTLETSFFSSWSDAFKSINNSHEILNFDEVKSLVSDYAVRALNSFSKSEASKRPYAEGVSEEAQRMLHKFIHDPDTLEISQIRELRKMAAIYATITSERKHPLDDDDRSSNVYFRRGTTTRQYPLPSYTSKRSAWDYVRHPLPETGALALAHGQQIKRDMSEPGIHSDGLRTADILNNPRAHVQPLASPWRVYRSNGIFSVGRRLAEYLIKYKLLGKELHIRPQPQRPAPNVPRHLCQRPISKSSGSADCKNQGGKSKSPLSPVIDSSHRVNKPLHKSQVPTIKLRGGGPRNSTGWQTYWNQTQLSAIQRLAQRMGLELTEKGQADYLVGRYLTAKRWNVDQAYQLYAYNPPAIARYVYPSHESLVNDHGPVRADQIVRFAAANGFTGVTEELLENFLGPRLQEAFWRWENAMAILHSEVQGGPHHDNAGAVAARASTSRALATDGTGSEVLPAAPADGVGYEDDSLVNFDDVEDPPLDLTPPRMHSAVKFEPNGRHSDGDGDSDSGTDYKSDDHDDVDDESDGDVEPEGGALASSSVSNHGNGGPAPVAIQSPFVTSPFVSRAGNGSGHFNTPGADKENQAPPSVGQPHGIRGRPSFSPITPDPNEENQPPARPLLSRRVSDRNGDLQNNNGDQRYGRIPEILLQGEVSPSILEQQRKALFETHRTRRQQAAAQNLLRQQQPASPTRGLRDEISQIEDNGGQRESQSRSSLTGSSNKENRDPRDALQQDVDEALIQRCHPCPTYAGQYHHFCNYLCTILDLASEDSELCAQIQQYEPYPSRETAIFWKCLREDVELALDEVHRRSQGSPYLSNAQIHGLLQRATGEVLCLMPESTSGPACPWSSFDFPSDAQLVEPLMEDWLGVISQCVTLDSSPSVDLHKVVSGKLWDTVSEILNVFYSRPLPSVETRSDRARRGERARPLGAYHKYAARLRRTMAQLAELFRETEELSVTERTETNHLAYHEYYRAAHDDLLQIRRGLGETISEEEWGPSPGWEHYQALGNEPNNELRMMILDSLPELDSIMLFFQHGDADDSQSTDRLRWIMGALRGILYSEEPLEEDGEDDEEAAPSPPRQRRSRSSSAGRAAATATAAGNNLGKRKSPDDVDAEDTADASPSKRPRKTSKTTAAAAATASATTTTATTQPATDPQVRLPSEQDYKNMLADELKRECDFRGIDYEKRATKAALIALLRNADKGGNTGLGAMNSYKIITGNRGARPKTFNKYLTQEQKKARFGDRLAPE